MGLIFHLINDGKMKFDAIDNWIVIVIVMGL